MRLNQLPSSEVSALVRESVTEMLMDLYDLIKIYKVHKIDGKVFIIYLVLNYLYIMLNRLHFHENICSWFVKAVIEHVCVCCSRFKSMNHFTNDSVQMTRISPFLSLLTVLELIHDIIGSEMRCTFSVINMRIRFTHT